MRNFLYISMLLFVALTAAADIRWEIQPEATNVSQRSRVQLKVIARWSNFEVFSVRTPRLKELKGAEVQDVVSFNESRPGMGKIEHSATYVFDLLVTNAPGSVVETGLIEVMTRGPEDQEFSSSTVPGVTLNVRKSSFLWILPAAAAAVLLLGALFFLGRKLVPKKEAAPEESLEDECLRELEECKELRLKGDSGAYFEKCENILRLYLRRKYSIADLEGLGEKEIMERGLDQRMIRTARELCALSFNVRYADCQTSGQEEKRFFDFIKEILTRNRPCRVSEEDELYIK